MALPPLPLPPPGAPPGPPGGTGAAMAPQVMAGSGAQASTAVKMALEALQKALPGLQMGSELHTAVLKAVAEISKHMDMGGGQGDQMSIIQQLVQAAKAHQAGPPPQMPGAGGPPPGAGAPPMMPPAAAA